MKTLKLILFEGINDLYFFCSFIKKVLNFIRKTDVKEYWEMLVNNFRRMLESNPEEIRIEVLEKDIILLLLSVGGKDNFRYIVNAFRPIYDKLRNNNFKIDSVIFVADCDAKNHIENLLEGFSKKVSQIKVNKIIYKNKLEDIILEVIKSSMNIEKDEDLKTIFEILEKKFYNDKYLKKRKISIIHAFLSPRCYGQLFDEIFEKFKNYEGIYELKLFVSLLKE